MLLSLHTSQWQMTSLQMKDHGERRKQKKKHQGNLETAREAFPLLWGLSKSLLKYGVSCFNPQRFPAPCYLCRLFFSHPQKGGKKTQASALTQFDDFSQDFDWDKRPAQLTPPYLKAKHLGGGRGSWRVNAKHNTTQSRCSCSVVFCGLFNGSFPKWIKLSEIKALSVSTHTDIDKYLSHDNRPNLFSKLDKPQSKDFWKPPRGLATHKLFDFSAGFMVL